MKKESIPQITHIKDLYIAAYLKAKNFPLHDAVLDDKKRTLFIFEETSEMRKTIMQFYDGTALVNPASFIEAFKSLRSLAYSMSDNKNMNRGKYDTPKKT